MNIDLFSDEVIVYIFKFLHVKDLISVSETTKRFNILSKERSIWKSIFERSFGTYKTINYCEKFKKYVDYTSKNKIASSDYWDGFINRKRDVILCYNMNNVNTKVFRFGNAEQISVGDNHIAVIKTNGELYTWGFGKHGPLGHGNEKDLLDTPTKVNLKGKIKQVDCVIDMTAALTDSGDIYIWGYNGFTKIGTSSLCITKPHPLKHKRKFKYISLGNTFLAAVSIKGDLYMWGKGSFCLQNLLLKNYKPSKASKIKVYDGKIRERIKQVSCGSKHVLILTHSNKLFAFGSNNYHQLGLKCDYCITPEKLTISETHRIKQISCGDSHSSFLTWSGKLFLWGSNRSYQLGLDKDVQEIIFPSNIFGDKVIHAECKGNKTGVIKNDFQIHIFGTGVKPFHRIDQC
jgi:alpha-tubulin suppressor-like RCC1 family protein